MPRITELRGWSISANVVPTPGDSGSEPIFELGFQDKASKDIIFVRFNRDVRDAIVRQLTGGIVLAGGELPKL